MVCLPNDDREMHTRTKEWLQTSQESGHKAGKLPLELCQAFAVTAGVWSHFNNPGA